LKHQGDPQIMIVVRGFAVPMLMATLAVACGGEDPGENDGNSTGGVSAAGGSATGSTSSGGSSGAPPMSRGPLLPWAMGNSWTYRVTEDSTVTTKRTSVGALELVGGTGPNKDVMANLVVTHKDDTGDGLALDETRSWQALEGERVVRYREQSFSRTTKQLELEEFWEPHKLHVDSAAAHVATNATWLESYKENKLPVGAQPTYDITTNDRWFVDGVESVTVPAGTFEALVLRKVSGSNAEKKYWYAPNVGKVKETGGKTEELTEYQVN
jgi:hypothetical protein